MAGQDLISIVVPVHNGQQYLRENVESVLNQTYCNLEVIYVCDRCTDKTIDILQEYAISDKRLEVCIVNENNEGVAGARNIGKKKAKGEWIIFLDSDDLFESDMIEVMFKQAVSRQADICCCFWVGFDNQSSRKAYNTNESIKLYCDTYPDIYVSNKKKYLFQLIEYNLWTKLIHKSIYQKESVNFGCHPNCDDFYFSLLAAMEATKIVYVDNELVHYRMDHDRKTVSTMIHNHRNYVWEASDALFQDIQKKENNYELKQSFYNTVCNNIYHFSSSLVYSKLFNNLYDTYFAKWGMFDPNVPSKLSYFNQEVYAKVCNHDTEMIGSEMIMHAKVHFVVDMLKKGTCGIWGCGHQGQKLLERLRTSDIDVQHVFDSDKKKWNTSIFGYTVEQFTNEKFDSIIVTSPQYYEEIKKQIGSRVGKVYNLEKDIFIH